MASLKFYLRKDKQRKDGRAPLYVRITENRKSRFTALGYYLLEKEWDGEKEKVTKAHKNSARMNAALANERTKYQSLIVEITEKKKSIRKQSIKEVLVAGAKMDFETYAKEQIQLLRESKRFGTANFHEQSLKRLNLFRAHSNMKPLNFGDFDYDFIADYEQFLRVNRESGDNTVRASLTMIRRMMNQAIREKKISRDLNPFPQYRIPKSRQSVHFLDESQLFALEAMNLEPDSNPWHARNLYVFAAYGGGLRISDILRLKWHHVHGDKLRIVTQKTGATVSFPLSAKARRIVDLYRPEKVDFQEYIFPMLSGLPRDANPVILYEESRKRNGLVNVHLRNLAKQLGLNHSMSMHTARHTFATMWLRNGGNLKYLQKLLGHCSISTTQRYLHVMDKDTDEAMLDFGEQMGKKEAEYKSESKGMEIVSQVQSLTPEMGLVRQYILQTAMMNEHDSLSGFSGILIDKLSMLQINGRSLSQVVRVMLIGKDAIEESFRKVLNQNSVFGDQFIFEVQVVSEAGARMIFDKDYGYMFISEQKKAN